MVDSIMGEHSVSGRSSAYGDGQTDGISASGSRSIQQARSESSSLNAPPNVIILPVLFYFSSNKLHHRLTENLFYIGLWTRRNY